MGLFSSTRQPHTRCALRCTAAGRQRGGSGGDGSGVEWRGGNGRAGQGRVPDCLGGLSRVGISSRSTRPLNGQPPSITNSSLIVGIMGIRNAVKPSGFFLFLNRALCFSSARYRNDLDSKWWELCHCCAGVMRIQDLTLGLLPVSLITGQQTAKRKLRWRNRQTIFAGGYFRGKIFSREDIFAGRYFRGKIFSREQ